MISDEVLKTLREAYDASTKGNWRRGYKQLETIEETKEWLSRMVEYNKDRPSLHVLVAMVDGSDPGDVLEDIETYYSPSLTGNGPTSEANALFIELAHNNMPYLLETIRELKEIVRRFNDGMREAMQ